jgi:DNA (cytosine-5)-methyltransferase 1
MKPYFKSVWANDISKKKAAVYRANHPGEKFAQYPIEEIKGNDIPSAHLAWSSFPCIDLSLAGKMQGINGKESGLVWQWLRVLDEMKEKPPILVVENVMGFVSSAKGEHYKALHEALVKRGYKVGPMALNAVDWLPQSRPRIFVVAVEKSINLNGLFRHMPGWNHPDSLRKYVMGLDSLVWWKLPKPQTRETGLSDIIQFDAPCDDLERSNKNIDMIPQNHYERLMDKMKNGFKVTPGYKRIRNGQQVLELRFDDVAGCLRTPNGGSSRQYLVLNSKEKLRTRLLTVRETARLMGAPDDYEIPGNYNDGYAAMGDAVAAPVTNYLAKYLLSPLSERI